MPGAATPTPAGTDQPLTSRSLTMPCVRLIAGPSGSGKTTLVNQHRRPGELLIDYDHLFQALTGLPAYHKPDALFPHIQAARLALLDALALHPVPAWAVTADPDRPRVLALAARLRAELTVLRVPAADGLARIAADPTRTDTNRPFAQAVAAWHRGWPAAAR